jgi:phosphate transport system substrate-binding protein
VAQSKFNIGMRIALLSAFHLALSFVALYAQPQVASMPVYVPDHQVTGVIRNYGSALAGVVKSWEDEFAKLQPGITFNDKFAGSDAAISGLATKEFDLAPNGREAQFIEYLSFYEAYGVEPFEVTVGTGAYDVPGRTWAEVIFVNKDNPLTQLTMKQLDGIFGEARTGAVDHFLIKPDGARSAKDNIRTWGELGLNGEWANKPIQTYGYAVTGMSIFFQQKVMHGSDKWNPNYREYAETDTKMVDPKISRGLGSRDMLMDISKDKYGIGWGGVGQAKGIPNLKIIALAEHEGGPYITPSLESVRNRTYPLTRSIFIYLNYVPGKELDPKLKEFLFFILSKQGQDVLRKQGEYLPLTPELVLQQRARLDQSQK